MIIEKSIFLNKQYRFKNKELEHLEENIYANSYKKFNEKNKSVKIFIAKNPYSELEHVAQEINKLVREQNYKYSNIAIISKNLDSIENIAKVIFSKYNIPIFIDEKTEITENIVIKYVLSILEIFTSNWNTEAVINYAKSGFLSLTQEEIYTLENYVRKCGINRKKWITPWIENEEIRQKIVLPLLKLNMDLNEEKNTCNFSRKLYEYLLKTNIQEKINEKIDKLTKANEMQIAKEYRASAEILVDVLDEITQFFQEDKMTIDSYKETLKIGLKNKELGKIPQFLDQVIIGDIDRTRSHNVKIVFIIGMNDGIFPSVNKNEGFLNDTDREILKQNNLEIAKGTTENLYADQFNIYKALTTSEENLYLSYTSSNKEGNSLRPSIIISKIKRIFPEIKEESDIIEEKSIITNQKATFEDLLKNIRKMKNGETIDDIWIDVYNWYNKNKYWKEKLDDCLKGLEYSNKAERITDENIKKLYGDTLKTSISRLEQYRKCPFSFYLKYGLKVQEEEEYKIRPIDTGTFMHDVLDSFFDRVVDISTLEDEEIEKIVDEIINEKLKLEKNYIFSSSPKFIILTNRLKKTVKESIRYIVYQMKNSDFKPSEHELEFSKKIDNVELVGKIDRVDIAKNEDGEFIRIIDYKSSEKNVDLNQMIAGTQIQLMTYIDAIAAETKKQPAGILYFNLIEPIIQESKNISDEEIEEKIRKTFKMNGLILADIKVIKMMDKSLEKGSSNIVPVYLDKEGNISNSRSNVVTREQFSSLQKVIKKVIKQIAKEILSGNIEIKPMYDKQTKTATCKYCAYKTICAFNSKENNYEYLAHKEKERILEEIMNR